MAKGKYIFKLCSVLDISVLKSSTVTFQTNKENGYFYQHC